MFYAVGTGILFAVVGGLAVLAYGVFRATRGVSGQFAIGMGALLHLTVLSPLFWMVAVLGFISGMALVLRT